MNVGLLDCAARPADRRNAKYRWLKYRWLMDAVHGLGMPVNDSPFKHFRNLGGHGQDAGMGEVALDRQREVIHANVIG